MIQQFRDRLIQGVHFEGMAQRRFGIAAIATLKVSLANQNIGSGVVGIEPDGTFQRTDGVIPGAAGFVGLAEAEVGHEKIRIGGDFLAQLANGLGRLAQGQQGVGDQIAGLRNMGIDLKRTGCFAAGRGIHVYPEHHGGGDQVRGGGIGGDLKKRGERLNSLLLLVRLQATVRQHKAGYERSAGRRPGLFRKTEWRP